MCMTNRRSVNVTPSRDATLTDEGDNLIKQVNRESKLDDATHDLFDRSCVRLDGVEVYAVISALTMATSIACIDNYQPTNLEMLYEDGSYLELVGETIFLLASACGILAGVHSTLIFALITMYGRTAIGMDRDGEFQSFLEKTGQQRINGYKTFLVSMYAFLVQVTLLIASKFPGKVKGIALPFIVYSGLFVHWEAKIVLKSASAIFTSPVRRGVYEGSDTQRKDDEKND